MNARRAAPAESRRRLLRRRAARRDGRRSSAPSVCSCWPRSAIGVIRFWRDVQRGAGASTPTVADAGDAALRDALTLRHLHATGVDCTSAEEARTPWRRWFHHCTFYGFVLCFASTSVAAIYHSVFGWQAPYAYTSLPVVLGTLGGVGLARRTGRALSCCGAGAIPRLAIRPSSGLDESFIALLFLTSLTGLAAARAARQRR